MAYSMQREYYNAALKSLAEKAGKLMRANALPCDGWLQYMKTAWPNHYRKLVSAENTINRLWDKTDTRSLEAWKTAVRQSVEGTLWAVEQFLKNTSKEGAV